MNDKTPSRLRIASQVVDGLKTSPLLLGVLVLNAIGIGAALFFLTKLAAAQASRFDVLVKMCLQRIGGAP